MNDPICTVEGCGRPCPDQAYICEQHGQKLAEELAKVSKIVDELDVVLARQTVSSERVGTVATKDVPLPYDDRVSDVAWRLENTLGTWARLIAEERGRELPEPAGVPYEPRCGAGIGCKHTSCAAIRAQRTQTPEEAAAEWILANLSWLRHHRAADEAYDELADAIRGAEHLVDSRAPRLYLGPCGRVRNPDGDPLDQPCPRDLYARPGRATVTCPSCTNQHDVRLAREWVWAQVEGTNASASEISAVCWSMFGDLVTPAMIRGYVRRGSVVQHASVRDKRGRLVPAYNVGEVMAAARMAAASPAARREAMKDAREMLADVG